MSKNSFLAVMPVYNELGCIEKVIKSWITTTSKFPGSEILVINDGSTDGTEKILDKYSNRYSSLKVIHKNNEGHGKTLVKAYSIAIKSNHDWIFQVDSDNQFVAKDFYKLWRYRKISNFVLGKRHNRKDPLYRIILSSILKLFLFLLFGKNCGDSNIPFRLIKKTYLKKLLQKVPKNVFAPNIFLTILAAKDNLNLINVPVVHLQRKTGKSTLYSWKYIKSGLRVAKEILCFRFC